VVYPECALCQHVRMPDVQPLFAAMSNQRRPADTGQHAAMPAPRQASEPDRGSEPVRGRSFVDFRPDHTPVVQVRVADLWLFGVLEGFGPGPAGTWRALVRWSEHPGRERRRWFDESDIRPLQV
jgi:hypothetical protein